MSSELSLMLGAICGLVFFRAAWMNHKALRCSKCHREKVNIGDAVMYCSSCGNGKFVSYCHAKLGGEKEVK